MLCVQPPTGEVAAVNPRIRLEKDTRLTRISIADPWIAWTTTNGRQTTLHRKRLNATSAPWTRPAATVPSTLLLTTDGTIVVRHRATGAVTSYAVGRRARKLSAVASALSRTKHSALRPWGSRQIAVVASQVARPYFPASGTPVTRCNPASPGGALGRTDRYTLRISPGISVAPSSSSSRYELTLCTRSGHRLLSRLFHDDADYYDYVAFATAVTGRVLTINLSLVAGFSSSAEFTDQRYVYVIGRHSKITKHDVSIVVASPAAAAYVERGRLWVSDARGLRRIPFRGSLTSTNTRLDLRPDGLLVRTPTKTSTVAIDPLPPGQFADPSAALGTGVPLGSADLCGTYDAASYGCGGGAPTVGEHPND